MLVFCVGRNFEEGPRFRVNHCADIEKSVASLTSVLYIGEVRKPLNRLLTLGSAWHEDAIINAFLKAYPWLTLYGGDLAFQNFVYDGYDYGTFLNGDYTLPYPINVDLMWMLIPVAKATTITGFRGGYQPNDIVNLTIGYDYEGFSARVSMLFQNNIFKQPDFWMQHRVNSEKYTRWDFSVKQELPWFGIQLLFNMSNITGENELDVNQKIYYPANEQLGPLGTTS